MTDQGNQHSGSRWEPAPRATAEGPPPSPPERETPAREGRSSLAGLRGRAGLAAAAVGLAGVSGGAGFAFGHLVNGDEVDQVGLVGERFPAADDQGRSPLTPPGQDGGGFSGRQLPRPHDQDEELGHGTPPGLGDDEVPPVPEGTDDGAADADGPAAT